MSILIEILGIDGSGKTSICEEVCKDFIFKNDVVFKNGFEKTYFTDEVQNYLEQYNQDRYDIFSHDLVNALYMMDLISNTKKEIIPILNNNVNVICDRYITSAEVYSLATTKSNITYLFDLYNTLPPPDLRIFLDTSPEIAYERILKRNKAMRFYENPIALKKIRETYYEIFETQNLHINVINADMELSEVFNKVKEIISQSLFKDN